MGQVAGHEREDRFSGIVGGRLLANSRVAFGDFGLTGEEDFSGAEAHFSFLQTVRLKSGDLKPVLAKALRTQDSP